MMVMRTGSIWWNALVGFLIVALCGTLLWGYHVGAYDGVDENGYIITARSLAERGAAGKTLSDPNGFVSGNYVLADNGQFYGKYPLGYPWLCALAWRLGGPGAVFWVNPLLAMLTVLGTFLLGREMISPFAGALAAILLATNPLHAYFGLSALSHSGSTCFAVWGMYGLWRWTERGGVGNALWAGAVSAYASTVRYTDGLLIAPIVAMVVWRAFRVNGTQRRRVGREFFIMTAAAVMTVTPLLIHHWVAFGAPWRTGYGLCGETTGFGWRFFTENWWLMLTRMGSGGLILLFPLGLMGLVYLVMHDVKRALLLGLWAVPGLLVYSAYYWAPPGEGPGYVRFFVSVFPPLILSAMVLLCQAVQARVWWEVGVGVFVALVATANLREAQRQLDRQMDRLLFAQETLAVVRAKLPDGTTLLASNRLLNFIESVGHYGLFALENFERNAIQRTIRVLDDNNPRPFQRRKAQKLAETQGNKTDSELTQALRDLVNTELEAGCRVAMIVQEDAYRRQRGRLGNALDLTTVATWSEARRGIRDDDVRDISWVLCEVKPRTAAPTGVAELEQQVDELDAKVRDARAEFNAQYPGMQPAWRKLQEQEKQLRDLREQLKKLAAKKPAVTLTNTPPTPTAGKGLPPAP